MCRLTVIPVSDFTDTSCPVECNKMPMLSLYLLAERDSNDILVTLLSDFDVVVTDLGNRVEAESRTDAIIGQLTDDDDDHNFLRLRLIFGPDGRVCTYATSDLTQEDRYNEFDVLFPTHRMGLNALYDALAELLTRWRSRGRPRSHWVTVPYEPTSDDDGE